MLKRVPVLIENRNGICMKEYEICDGSKWQHPWLTGLQMFAAGDANPSQVVAQPVSEKPNESDFINESSTIGTKTK